MHRPRSSLSVALPFEEYLFLRDDATFQELSEHVDICLHVIKHPPTWRPDYVKYKTMFILQNLSIREAIDEGAIYFPLPPDTVQADGTLPTVLRVLEEQDKRAYFGFSPRVELETFAWMLGKFGAGHGVQGIRQKSKKFSLCGNGVAAPCTAIDERDHRYAHPLAELHDLDDPTSRICRARFSSVADCHSAGWP